MSDFKQLGIEFVTVGDEKANRALDNYEQGAVKGKAAAEGLAAANEKASDTFGQVGAEAGKAASLFDEFVQGVIQGMKAELEAASAARELGAGTREAASGADRMAQRVAALRAATDPLAAAIDKTNKQLVEAKALLDANKLSAEEFEKAEAVLTARMAKLSAEHAKAQKAIGLTTSETVNMGRQMADVGTQLAMGMNPLMILVQQGPQIADVFAMAKARGVGFGAAMASVGRMIAPFVPLLVTVGTTAAVAFGGAALAVHALNKEHGDLAKGLGLTKDQMERLKEKGVETHITLKDVFKGTWNYLADVVDKNTKDAQAAFGRFMDRAAKFAFDSVKNIVGFFGGAFAAIKATWSMLPAALGDVVITATNNILKALDDLINKAIAGLNKMIATANSAAKAVGLSAQLPTLGNVSMGQLGNPYKGSAAAADAAASKAFADGFKTWSNNAGKVMNDIGKSIIKAGEDRVKDAEGKAAKERKARDKKDPRDMSDERDAQIAQMIAQADQEQLQAQLALTKDVWARVAIQKQIAAAELAIKIAQVNREEAAIADDKGLSDAKKADLTRQLENVKLTIAYTGFLKDRAITEQGIAEAAKNEFELKKQSAEAEISLLEAQQKLTRSGAVRFALEQRTLEKRQQLEIEELRQITLENGYRQDQVDQAREQIKIVQQRQDVERQLLKRERTILDDINDAKSAVEEFGNAFKSGDFATGIVKLVEAIEQMAETLTSSKVSLQTKIGSIGGVLSGLGGVIGGRGGGILSAAGGGISGGLAAAGAVTKLSGMFGGALGGLAGLAGPIGAVVGLGSFLGSILGGNEQRRQQRRDAENQAAQAQAERMQEVANQKRDLETRLVEASGDKIAILAAQRAQELSTLDASNQALAKQVYEAEDRKNRADQVHQMELAYLDAEAKATGSAADALAQLTATRKDELDAIDATLRPLQQLVYAAQDAATAVDAAKGALQDSYDAETAKLQTLHENLASAYERESGALQQTIGDFSDLAKSLHSFSDSLDSGALANLSPENAYTAASAKFRDTSARAQMGDLQAGKDLQGVEEAFLQASQAYNGVSPKYYADLAAVKDATEKAAATADRTVSNAQAQLDALNKLVAGYLDVANNTESTAEALKKLQTEEQAAAGTMSVVEQLLGIRANTLSMVDALAAYQGALAAQNQALASLGAAITAAKGNPANQPVPADSSAANPGYRSTNGDYAAYVEGNPDLLAAFKGQVGWAKGRSEAEFGMLQWTQVGHTEPRPVRPYAQGGGLVAGSGGIDSQRAIVDLTPGEQFSVKTPAHMEREARATEQVAVALEKLGEKLDALVYEAKVDKSQRADIHREVKGALTELRDSFETGKRRAGARG